MQYQNMNDKRKYGDKDFLIRKGAPIDGPVIKLRMGQFLQNLNFSQILKLNNILIVLWFPKRGLPPPPGDLPRTGRSN